MARSFAKKSTSLFHKVAQELAALHALASDPHRDGLSPHVASTRRQLTVGLEDKSKGFLQITASFAERSPLGIHAGDFLYVGHIPSPALLDHRREFTLHTSPLPQL